MTPLAQISSDMLGPIAPWLISASAVLFLVNQAITFWKDHMREKPIPGETYATKEEMRQAHGRMNRERDETNAKIAAVAASAAAVREHLDAELVAIREQLASNNQAGEERATKLHDRINAMLESTSELRGEVRRALATRRQ